MKPVQKRMAEIVKEMKKNDDRGSVTETYMAKYGSGQGSFIPSLSALTGNTEEADKSMVRYLASTNYWGKGASKLSANARAEMLKQVVSLGDELKHEHIPPEWFFRTNLLEDLMVEKLAPRLMFSEFVNRTVTDRDAVEWRRNLYSWYDDPLKTDPAKVGPNGEFPTLTTTKFESRQATLARRGFSLVFDFDVMHNEASGFNQVAYDFERAVNWYASYLNTRDGIVLTNNWDTSQTGDDAILLEAADAIWSSASAKPIKDIRDLRQTFKTSSRLNATDLYVNSDNYRELLDYVDFSTQRWAMDPFTNRATLTIDDITVHEAPVDGGLQASTGIMLSRQGAAPLTMYERVYPEFTNSGGVHVMKNINGKNGDTTYTFFRKTASVMPDSSKVGMLYTL